MNDKWVKIATEPGVTFPAFTAFCRLVHRAGYYVETPGIYFDHQTTLDYLWYAARIAERYQRRFSREHHAKNTNGD